MARTTKQKPLDTNILAVDTIPQEAHEATNTEDRIAHIGESLNEERDLVNQLLGQAQMATALGEFSRTFGISKLAYIKENKLYKGIAGMKLRTDSEFLKGTWEEFCELLGQSVDKVDLDIANLKTFGEEALENMQRIGIGYRELRQYRRLPESEQMELIEAAKKGDKDTFIDIAEDLISRHTQERERLTKQVTELEADAKATEKVIESKNGKLDEQERQLHKLQNKSGDWHPRVFEVSTEVTRVAAQGLEAVDRLEQLRTIILDEEFDEKDREMAIEQMAIVYFDAVLHLTTRAAEMMAACEDVFGGYKDRAKPLIEAFAGQQQTNGAVKH